MELPNPQIHTSTDSQIHKSSASADLSLLLSHLFGEVRRVSTRTLWLDIRFSSSRSSSSAAAICVLHASSRSSAGSIALPAMPTAGPRSAAGSVMRPSTPRTFPAVGDWVGVHDGIIHVRLDRRGTVSRAAAGRAVEEQVVAANVDVIFLVTALSGI